MIELAVSEIRDGEMTSTEAAETLLFVERSLAKYHADDFVTADVLGAGERAVRGAPRRRR